VCHCIGSARRSGAHDLDQAPLRRGLSLLNMFVFFSNRLGCLGSIIVSALVTVVILFLFGIL
jgi:hypothetical protein